jgi:flagellar biosynthesis protein FlhF
MRLRSFSARTMSEAMSLASRELGADAIIVSTQEEDGLMRVTAALDEPADRVCATSGACETIDDLLPRHGLTAAQAEKIASATFAFAGEEPLVALSSALAALYPFKPVQGGAVRRFLLAGPPGAGKTVTAAKLAARHVIGGGRARLISADAARAGAADQLAAFAQILGVPLHRADSARALETALQSANESELVVIDTAGVNPYDKNERRELSDLLLAAHGVEPVLVMPGGGDSVDCAEAAQVFAAHGVTRLIATRLDATRRFGGVLAAADAAHLSFAEAGISPAIADGLSPLNPVLLARFLLAAPAQRQATKRPGEA